MSGRCASGGVITAVAGIRMLLLMMVRLASGMTSNSSIPRSSVAVIGGGVASLRFAQRASSKFSVTVFDTGRLRPGGRCSSRYPGDPPPANKNKDASLQQFTHLNHQLVDHAAQMLCVPQGRDFQDFSQQVEQWERDGVVKRFPANSLYEIRSSSPDSNSKADCSLQPLDNAQDFFHGTLGMGSIPQAMVDGASFDIQQDVWVSPSGGVRYSPKRRQWSVQSAGQHYGFFDHLIIGHNGKCADRLMSKTPAKKVHSLLRVNFAPSVAAHGGKRMTLNSLYSLTVALKGPSPLSRALPEPFMAGFIHNEPTLRFVTSQTRKYPPEPTSDDDDGGVEVWTVLSSPTFTKKHKAAQEFLSDETIEEVSSLLLQGLERSLSMPKNSIRPVKRRLQLWGAALPVNTWQNGHGFIYDADHAVGVCGDWLVEPSIAGAWTSGNNLAEHMLKDPKKSVGLEGSFRRVTKNDIGVLQPAGKRSLANY